jgi:hypothetical protein
LKSSFPNSTKSSFSSHFVSTNIFLFQPCMFYLNRTFHTAVSFMLTQCMVALNSYAWGHGIESSQIQFSFVSYSLQAVIFKSQK